MSDAPLARYSFRRSVLEQDRTYTLHHDRLVVDGRDLPAQVYPLADVQKVHLKYEHTKQRAYYQCFIHTRRGRISLRHLDYVSFANFADRRAAYTPFVKALLAELARYPGVRFRAGSILNFVFAIVGLPAMVALGVLAYSLDRPLATIFAGFMAFLCLVMIGPSRPRRLDPLAPPADLLPQ